MLGIRKSLVFQKIKRASYLLLVKDTLVDFEISRLILIQDSTLTPKMEMDSYELQ